MWGHAAGRFVDEGGAVKRVLAGLLALVPSCFVDVGIAHYPRLRYTSTLPPIAPGGQSGTAESHTSSGYVATLWLGAYLDLYGVSVSAARGGQSVGGVEGLPDRVGANGTQYRVDVDTPLHLRYLKLRATYAHQSTDEVTLAPAIGPSDEAEVTGSGVSHFFAATFAAAYGKDLALSLGASRLSIDTQADPNGMFGPYQIAGWGGELRFTARTFFGSAVQRYAGSDEGTASVACSPTFGITGWECR